MYRVTLSKRAQKDLRRIDVQHRSRIVEALRNDLAADPPPDNIDVKAISGAPPWHRLRIGSYRVIYRPAPDDPRVRLVDRVVHRRDLEDAVSRL